MYRTENSYHYNFFCERSDSDTHFILPCKVKMMIPTQRISMTLIKFRENICQIISHGSLKMTLKSINFLHENMQRHTESIKFWLFFVNVSFSGTSYFLDLHRLYKTQLNDKIKMKFFSFLVYLTFHYG